MELMNTREMSGNDDLQCVTFYLGNEMYGINMRYLQEIIRVPDVVKVPRTPSYIRGLANLRGTILTVVDCRLRLGLASSEDTDASRVIVLTAGSKKLGYVVDRVAGVITIHKDEIEKKSGSETAADFLEGIAKIEKGKKLVMLLDAEKLLNYREGEIIKEDIEVRNNNVISVVQENNKEKTKGSNEEQLQMISFKIGNEEYGIEVGSVQEIVRFSEEVSEVPNVPPYILGVISLRNKVLPIVSLRRLFHMEECSFDERSRIVVIRIDEDGISYTVGLRVDVVLEVLRIAKVSVAPVPPLLRVKDSEEISGICKLNEGSRLVYVLDPKKLFSYKLRESADILRTQEGDERVEVVDANDEEEQLVSFLVEGIECAFPIEDVREIIRPTEIIAVPKAPDFVEGVINLRGTIVPVIDLRKKFGLTQKNRDDRNRIVIVEISGRYTGLVVDSVKEVLKIKHSQIEGTPEILMDEIDQRFIRGIAKFDEYNRMIILLSVEEVLSGKEKNELMAIDEIDA
ncbi:purine-binding chemotaxis protein CheW [Caldanaerobius fijiensis DSM 17918]|uniref:Purine-binding chemotaxis protein CheW n=1 Tax=Caldanaerobius fijiensis DSM 17918 TaxID=1121256 RepID=A0A1M5ES04_9THEO|nr:chemotaxis protein CheW [Caldanaerobius fijiensis]SHF81926.1 purine-binding chemotaxis protein CheW [Caldanaerobius fijiensis DSM 17918]